MVFSLMIVCLIAEGVNAQSHLDALEYDDRPAPAEVFKARRDALMARVGDEAVVMLYAAPMRTRNNDVEFVYRQNDNLLYLTGFNEPNAVLVLIPKGTRVPDQADEEKMITVHEVIFVQERDPRRERSVSSGDRLLYLCCSLPLDNTDH